MTQLHLKRFGELTDQLQKLADSRRNGYDPTVGENREEIESDALIEWSVKARNLISKACGQESEHYRSFVDNEQASSYDSCYEILTRIRAVFLAAKEDFEGGYLRSTKTLVQAEVFDSELEQARALFDGGYTTAAAVIAGVVLETTLRELCDRNGISHGKMDKMNADLAKAGVYNSLVQKRNTALAGLRNSAAHGKPEEFTTADVDSMIRDVERFVAEHLTA
jgi:hypothetical protein